MLHGITSTGRHAGPRKTRKTQYRKLLPFLPLPFLLLVGLSGCRLLFEAPDFAPSPIDGEREGLTAEELDRFCGDNLGEVSPGLLYRSAKPSAELLDFLGERVGLRHVVTLLGGPTPQEEAFVARVGGKVTAAPMSVERPPTPRNILALIRATHEARSEGRALLVHCRAGADRSGVMVAVWRLLFQGQTDREALFRETRHFGHVSPWIPMVRQTIDRFRPELFRPFVEDAALLDDEEAVRRLEARYFQGYPLLSGDETTASGPLEVGAGRSDLLEGLAEPVQLATYGPFPGFATGVRDPVFARSLVLECQGKRLAIVSCDLLMIDHGLRGEVLEALRDRGVELDDLLLDATHTHTSIGGYVRHWPSELYILGTYRDEIRRHLVERIAAAVSQASAGLEPALVGIGRAFVEGLSVNRRLGRTVDPEVGFIRFDRKDGRPLALLACYGAHPILAPADGKVSADYPGRLARMLDERFGFGLFLQGALGDVNARIAGREPVWQSEGLAEEMASRLFRAIEAAARETVLREETVLASMTSDFELPPLNVNIIPDLFFPLDWLLGAFLDWPRRAPLQAIRLGDAAIVACSTEAGSRLGLRIKRRSPAPYPFVVTHANGYSGYAVTAVGHGRSKLDPTSLVAMNGASHGTRLVETALDLLEVQWGERIGRDTRRLSPAARQRFDDETRGLLDDERERLRELAEDEEREETMEDLDPTLPRSRRRGIDFRDATGDFLRLESYWLYLDDLNGGQGIPGRRREWGFDLRARFPGDLRVTTRLGYARSDWDAPSGRGTDEGLTDLEVSLERPFELSRDFLSGSALRAIPLLGIVAPTGEAKDSAPLAFAASTGVWRPTLAGVLEWTWDTDHTLSLEAQYKTALGRSDGRRPGDLLEMALGYSERFGSLSLFLDLTSTLRLPDSRPGPERLLEVEEASVDLGLRPGISFGLFDRFEGFVQGRFTLARTGSGAPQGDGLLAGISIAY
ncbi:MAG: neutral/alkaline non-lysosomal ceramidase N-terminal domain-containing protein [Planctomycetota bacterium]|nr:neutral/alkaline non-lysosomal ceramidase N-terminal domain-containing protein [Planctomycetota bacterium]